MAEERSLTKHVTVPPANVRVGQDLKWDAPWFDARLWVELPFWLMVDNATFPIMVAGHEFPVTVHDNYFELHIGEIADSRRNAIYRGPAKELDRLSEAIQEVRKTNPDQPLMWRKCKTVIKIGTRCNEEVWKEAVGGANVQPGGVQLYLAELCRAHIPVLNSLVQSYRLATYDYFPYELAPWDIPFWGVEHDGRSVGVTLVYYREWDGKPMFLGSFSSVASKAPRDPPTVYQLIHATDLLDQLGSTPSPGEMELLDAMNFMERGDYSGGVRRITTAIEVIVEAVVGAAIEQAEGKPAAVKFIERTRTNFPSRVKKYEELSKRKLTERQGKSHKSIRDLRHRIVHQGYRITSAERGMAQQCVDTGRWLFNWFENEPTRIKIRENRIAYRSLGRDISFGSFRGEITPDGVVISLPN